MSAPGYNKGGCVALATGSSMGLWEVKNCSTFKAKYICRQNLGTPVNPELPAPYPTPSLAAACPPGWSSDAKLRHCYKVRGAGGGLPWPLWGVHVPPRRCRAGEGACFGACKGQLRPHEPGWGCVVTACPGMWLPAGWGRCSAPFPVLSPLRCRFFLPQVFNFEKLQEKKTWIAAQEFCRELGAQLLSLGSYEEEHFVANTLNKIFG